MIHTFETRIMDAGSIITFCLVSLTCTILGSWFLCSLNVYKCIFLCSKWCTCRRCSAPLSYWGSHPIFKWSAMSWFYSTGEEVLIWRFCLQDFDLCLLPAWVLPPYLPTFSVQPSCAKPWIPLPSHKPTELFRRNG